MQKQEKKQKRNKKQVNRSFIVSIALIGTACYFAIMIVSLRLDIRERKAEEASLREQVTQQDVANDNIKKALDEENESKYMEQIAREELDLIMPDERVYADSAK